jgi:aryl-alcohol dehydrogenase-like predicted oxidoreductase
MRCALVAIQQCYLLCHRDEPPEMIEKRPYGDTGMQVSALGLGAGQLGDERLSDAEAEALLKGALDAGITLIDTAPSYGVSEPRIGRFLGSRREEVVLSTKLGYGVPGVPDWTGACITGGVEQALRVLRTDRIDIAHLHSCPWTVLAQGEVVAALESAKAAGKLRAIAYSGENEDLEYARASGRFDGLMASLNPFEQRTADAVLPQMGGMGFIAKRPVANAPWRFAEQPHGDYSEPYWLRMRAMGMAPPGGMPWGEFALRFTLSVPGVASAIVGTGRLAHLLENVGWAAKGPLDSAVVEAWRARFREADQGWTGQV